MNDKSRIYAAFLGAWTLIPESCRFEQGDPPISGSYYITDNDGRLTFLMDWVDAEGRSHQATLDGIPNGGKVPFNGGEIADALSIKAVSPRELNSSAYYKGQERMTAQRQLDDTGEGMRVIQVVRFPDGSRQANVSIYRKQKIQ